MPCRYWPASLFSAKKILFHLLKKILFHPQSQAVTGFLSNFRKVSEYFRWLRGRPAQGFPAQNFGQYAQRAKAEGVRPSEKPVLTLTLTEAQLNHLAFAVYCQASSLEDSHEADEPEVIEAMECLNGVSAMCIALKKGALS